MTLTTILIIAGAAVLGAIVSQAVFAKLKFFDIKKAKAKSDKLLEQSREDSIKVKEEATQKAEDIRENTTEMANQMKTLIHTIEQNVKFKEEALERRNNRNKSFKNTITQIEKIITDSEEIQNELDQKIKEKLAQRLGENMEGLTAAFVTKYKAELKEETAERIQKLVDEAKDKAGKTAKNIIRGALQKFTDRTSVEKKEAKVLVKREESKALIVGKDARNVKLLEELLEVDIVFNDEPKTITVSSFNLLRKGIARIALEKLIKMRRVGETEIKNVIKEAKKIVSDDLIKIGDKALKKMGFKRKFHQDLYKIIGRLKYRTSYGQNILLHSFEVAYMAELLASELGLDVRTAKIAAFFHDIGKAIDQQVEGSHDVLTKEIMERYGFSKEEVHAAWTHHEAETPETPEARLVMAADAISAGRPGARQESLDKYLERLRALEEIATSFDGVQKTFAISAGRELRVMVSPDEVKDEALKGMANNIAEQIEENLSYPGKIKVNVIRRTKASDTAK